MARGGQAEKKMVVALLFDSDLTAFGSFTSNSLFALLLYIQLFVCLMFSLLTFANEEIVLSGFAEKKTLFALPTARPKESTNQF